MTCKPSQFHLVEDELHRLMDQSGTVEQQPPAAFAFEEKVDSSNVTSFERAVSKLGDEIMESLTEKKKEEKKEKSWFPFL